MKTNERKDHFARMADGLRDPDAAGHDRYRLESIAYFTTLNRVVQRDKIDPADAEIVNGDLPVLRSFFGDYVGSARFKQDMNTYASELKAGRIPRRGIEFLASVADAYNAEIAGRAHVYRDIRQATMR